jgi:2'-5' RNA ligase
MLPHYNILIPRLAAVYLAQRTAGTTGNRTEVGLFIRLPQFMAEQFPSLGKEDTSPPHVTMLYSGDVPAKREQEWLHIVQGELSKIRGPVMAAIDGSVDYFTHADKGRRVAYSPVRFSHDLAAFKWNVRDKLMDAGFEVKDSFPLVFKPHVTLAYLEGTESTWIERHPIGSWEFSEIEVWGLPKPVVLSMDDLNGRRPKWDAFAIPDKGEPQSEEGKRQDFAVSEKRAKKLAKRYMEITPPPFVG